MAGDKGDGESEGGGEEAVRVGVFGLLRGHKTPYCSAQGSNYLTSPT